jgi:D-sedoheptulose 7-phosphate isomerase
MRKIIKKRIQDNFTLNQAVLQDENIIKLIEEISEKIVDSLSKGGKVFFAGNGGSFSDSFHLAGEFVSRFMFDRESLPAIALGGNNSIITAIGNDYHFNQIFKREISALSKKDDVFIAISTSGNSINIINAITIAKENGVHVYGFTGESGGKMKNICRCIQVPSNSTPRIQEIHILIGHVICELVEDKVFGRNKGN